MVCPPPCCQGNLPEPQRVLFCFNARGKGKDTDSKDNVSKKFLPCLLAAMPPTTVIAVSSAVFKVDGDVIS